MEYGKAYSEIVAKLGSQAELARVLGKRQSTVAYWRKSGVPAEEAVRLEKLTDGLVPAWLSRPDLWCAPKRRSRNA